MVETPFLLLLFRSFCADGSPYPSRIHRHWLILFIHSSTRCELTNLTNIFFSLQSNNRATMAWRRTSICILWFWIVAVAGGCCRGGLGGVVKCCTQFKIYHKNHINTKIHGDNRRNWGGERSLKRKIVGIRVSARRECVRSSIRFWRTAVRQLATQPRAPKLKHEIFRSMFESHYKRASADRKWRSGTI